ncbi:protein PIN-LIKES 3-like [Durio zibethinus]|uniref:Protein PIN-LIKES 3-like n=1 Tax=Durio zibethinus TaxID=66656 RepID=A0A6P5YWF9_DURZI|nr:protein PIN-LIKES 3-like [Durio zibethinus]XP_022744894.1 protein PIN-LIKES 3-like [Durio zibethinus]XP_022744895.1 protein PIN-LIKES 3-like [Durio zibethinus]XP_022744896.1 protein PIN-LIKES 3-like [Durio zibethinus]XP_022744897.1 protein PIN-LIKES 3-like [Durio zibethinus]
MELLNLFITSLIPVVKVLLVIAVGLFLATERIDLLGANARHHLNNLVFYVFFPALIGCSLADTITIENLATLWFMPVNIFISCIIGSALGWILVKITRTPRHLKGLVIACSSAANLGNMLLIILPAICEQSSSPFGDSSTCSAYGEAYASLSLAIQAIYVWSILYFIMRTSANCEVEEIKANDCTIIVKTSGQTTEILSETCAEPLLTSNGCSGDNIYQVDLPQIRDEGNEKISTFGKIKQCFMTVIRSKSLKMIFAPSTIAAIVGFIVGIVSPIRNALVGDSAPVHVIYSSIELIGEAGIPSITLIVGANLLKGLKGSGVGASLIVGIIVIRNILLPVCGIVVVKTANYLGVVDSDSFYQFTLLLQYAIPPAMNIGTISQMLGTGESEFSVLMLWNYVVAAFSLTLWTAFYMWLVT